MRYWINTVEGHHSDSEWFETLDDAQDAALELSAALSGRRIQIGTFNLGGPSYIIKEVFA